MVIVMKYEITLLPNRLKRISGRDAQLTQIG